MNLFSFKSASVYNRKNINVSREKFYSRFIFEKNINSITDLIKNLNTKAVVVKNNIQFDNLAFGSNTKSVTSILGKSKCNFKFIYGNLEHKVLVYKMELDGYTSIVNCNFLNNKLFYVHLWFPYNNQSFKQYIFNKIEKEYNCILNDDKQDIELTNINKEKLLIEGDINLNLYYISNDNSIHELIDAEFLKMVEAKELKARKAFF